MPRGSAEPEPPVLRAALIPASLVTVFLLIYVAHLPFFVAAAASVPFLLLFVVAPGWAKRSIAAFDRDVVRLLTSERQKDLPARFSRAVGMRLFAPPARVAERRGLVASEVGTPGEARQAYRKAMRGYEDPDAVPMQVLLGYAHASHALGDDPEAIRAYRKVLATQGPMPRLEQNLAHALIRRGEDLREAMDLLDRAEAQAGTERERAEIEIVRALGEARRGRRATAKDVLRKHQAREEPSFVELLAELDQEVGEPAQKP